MASDTFDFSDFFGPSLQIGATILGVGSQIAKGEAAKTIAERRRVEAEFSAKQMEMEAEASRGVGLRGAMDEKMKAARVQSTQIARAAASGAGGSDPTVLNIISRTAGEGAYRALLAVYEGEAQARLDMVKDTALLYEGATGVADASRAAQMANMAAGATALAGGAKAMSMYEKYYSGPTPGGATTSNSAGFNDNGSWLDAGSSFLEGVT